jgi:hypothetical protein
VIVPTPAAFNTTVSAPEPPPGGAAIITSPPLGDTNGVTVALNGISTDDLTALAYGRHQCLVNFVRPLRELTKIMGGQVFQRVYDNVDQAFLIQRAAVELGQKFVQCVAFVDALQTYLAAHPSAAAAQASCKETQFQLSVTGSGAKTRLRSVRVGPLPGAKQSLELTCQPTTAGLTMALTSNTPGSAISSIIGSQLRVGVARSIGDSSGGQLTASFSEG